MGKEFVKSVCMVCMLCTIHTHCSVHHNIQNLGQNVGPIGSSNHDLARPNWSEPSEPVESALNPQLDLKQFQNFHSREHDKHFEEGSDKIKLKARLLSHPAMKVSAESDGSVHQNKIVNKERFDLNRNENILKMNLVDSDQDSFGKDILDDLKIIHSSGVNSNPHRHRISRDTKDVDILSEQFHMRKVFAKFGDGETMTYEGFERLLKTVGLERLLNNGVEEEGIVEKKPLATSTKSPNNTTRNVNNFNATQVIQQSVGRCLKSRDVFSAFINPSKDESDNGHGHSHTHDHDKGASTMKVLDEDALYKMCPTLLYQLTSVTDKERDEGCFFTGSVPAQAKQEEEINMGQVWLYASLSILGISLCGLLGVAVIPIMQEAFYHQLLQFLVALAIGTLCGDALIHLLPHAMGSGGNSHSTTSADHGYSESDHNARMWKGLIAALGLVFFFITEKCLLLGGELLKRRQRKRKMREVIEKEIREIPSRVRVMRDADNNTANSTVGEKLCKHKYSSYPYCYGEITTDISDDHHHKNSQYNKTEHNHNTSPPLGDKTRPPVHETHSPHVTAEGDHEPQMSFLGHDGASKAMNEKGEAMELNPSEAESYTVIIREHENAHHGHSHSHGHVHSAPSNLTSVACMVIMGDGLHNLTDGMAIGAAFAANIAGGFSTAIAVFCHELPHEIGDFAVLLKAGMSPKQAIFYNVLSSVLCLVGMIIGVYIGQQENALQWTFALAAGMFLYIALVDMIPELTSSHSNEGGSMYQFLLQICGLLTGLGIMLLIAAYEHDLQHLFND